MTTVLRSISATLRGSQVSCPRFVAIALAMTIVVLTTSVGRADETVTFFESAFLPSTITITMGETVHFVWDEGDHELWSGTDNDDPDAGLLFSEIPIDEDNPEYSYTFNVPGNYSFFDALDDDRTGSITVNVYSHTVSVFDNEFFPVDIAIFVGDEIDWVFDGDIPHTTTSGEDLDDPDYGELWDADIDEDNLSFQYQFDETGYFPYFCVPHATMGMVGSVTVQELFVRGDIDANESMNINDPIGLLLYLFSDGDEPVACEDARDADDDGEVDLQDAIYLLNFLFSADGKILPAPYPQPGPDRTDDDLVCTEDD